MFNIGDIISYRAAGVCLVEDIRKESLAGEQKTYYILKPVAKHNSTVYVPLDNALLCERMAPLMDKAEAAALLQNACDAAPFWVDNPKERQAAFSSVIANGKRAEIAAIVRALSRHKREVKQTGRKFFAGDERLLNAAVKAIVGELSYVLCCDEQEVIHALCGE